MPAHHHDARCERNARDRDNIADEIEIELFIERCIDDCGRDDEEERGKRGPEPLVGHGISSKANAIRNKVHGARVAELWRRSR